MISKKSIAIALAGALALGLAGVASAKVVSVGGITWNTDSPFDLTIQGGGLYESAITGTPQTLLGYGTVANINGFSPCATPGCNLTFTFSYNATAVNGDQIVFDGGTVSFYVSNPGTFDPGDPSSASNGTLWLTLTGAPAMFNLIDGTTAAGTLLSTVVGTVPEPASGSNGTGWLNASDGTAAAPYFQTHSQLGADAPSDFLLTTNFQVNPQCGAVNPSAFCAMYPIVGNATLTGRTAVPEPSELGLMGLGLGLLGFLFWRRRQEASDRA